MTPRQQMTYDIFNMKLADYQSLGPSPNVQVTSVTIHTRDQSQTYRFGQKFNPWRKSFILLIERD